MLKLLENVRTGIEKPSALSNATVVRSISNFDVSSFKQISPADLFTVSIQHTQVDNCEGRFLLAGRSDGSLLLYNTQSNTTTSAEIKYSCECLWKCSRDNREAHKYSVECVRWFPINNDIFVSAGFDHKLKVWDTSCMQCVDTISFNGKVFNFDLSPSMSRNCAVATCSNQGVVSIFELQSGTNVHTLKEHVGDVLSCQWSPLDEYILATGGADNKVLLWDVRSARSCLMSLNRCNTLQTTSERPCIYNFTAHTGVVNAITFVRNGLKLISCGTDNTIRLWDTLTGKNELVDYESFFNSSKRSIHVDTSRDTNPQFLFMPNREGINIYEVDTGKLVKSLTGHFSNVNCCAYEPVKNELYSGCTDGLILVWDDEAYRERV